MEYIHDSNEFIINNNCVTVLGNFDGVHIGHQKLLEVAKSYVSELELKLAVFSFYPPPTWVLGCKKKKLIVSREKKVELMKSEGVDIFVEYPFDLEFANIDESAFLENFLIEMMNTKVIVVGENYHFGKDRLGNAESLKKLANEYGIKTHIVPDVKLEQIVVSSTMIRNAVEEGDINKTNEMLGRPYCVSGKVMKGKQLGRTIGFPTINLEPNKDRVYPPNGVYASIVKLDGKRYIGMTNIGVNPTVNGKQMVIETNIFDFNKDIYDKEVDVEFYKYIRSEKKFNGIDELKNQITRDKESVLNYFQRI